MSNYCCNAFKEQAEGGPDVGFDPDGDGKTWNINGCCGGGCFVVTAMCFCPFCGTKLENPND